MVEAEQNGLVEALRLHQSGAFGEAETRYRLLLSSDPNCLDAKHLLGALLVQTNRIDEAVALLETALQQHPTHGPLFTNLGTAYSRAKRFNDAANAYRRALQLIPRDADANRNLASVLVKAERFDEAISQFERCVALFPDAIDLKISLGRLLVKQHREEQAKPYYEAVLLREPNNRAALLGLGQIFLKDKSPDERAVDIWRRLAALDPDDGAIQNNLATVLKNTKNLAEGEIACRRAIEIVPDFFPAYCNLGLILSAQNRLDEATQVLLKAIEIGENRELSNAALESDASPKAQYQRIDDAMWHEFGCIAYCQLAAITNLIGKADIAESAVDRALAIRDDDVDTQMMRGFLYLQRGDFELGWPYYEWRRKGTMGPRSFSQQEWKGEPLHGKTLLVHAEQGLGDTLHFIRYARLVDKANGKIVFLCHKPLAKFIRQCPYLDQVVADGETLPHVDLQIPLLSMPSVFKTTFDTVPRQVPYLFADPDLVEVWRERLREYPGFRIGIAWQGNRDFAHDELRRVPLAMFRSLAEIDGVRLFCLQRGDGLEQVEGIDFELIQFEDFDRTHGPFMDSAALMENLDLIISPCTAVPHLAGGLGRPVWLLKSFAAEWRWMSDDREQNPWYPTMTMFRQPALYAWEPVFEKIRQRLEPLLSASKV